MTEKQNARPRAELLSKLKLKGIPEFFEYAVRLIMSFLLSRASFLGGLAPFGAAFAGAAPLGIAGTVSTIGAFIGYITGGSITWSMKYLAIITLTRSAFYIMRYSEIFKKEFFKPLVTFLFACIVGFVYAAESGWAVVPTVLFTVEAVLSGSCCFFFDIALMPWADDSEGPLGRVSHSISSIALFSALLIALCNITLFDVMSIGRAFAVMSVMVLSFKGGIGTGCAFGAAMGMAMDLASGTAPFFTSAYAASAAISGIFSKNGKLFFLLSFITANSIMVVWTWNAFGALFALYETFAASVIFILLPDKFMVRINSFLPTASSGYGFLRAREYARGRIMLAGDAFMLLFDAVHTHTEGDVAGNPSVIFDKAADKVCRECSESTKCWQKDYIDTLDILNNLMPKLLEKGSITKEDFPKRFSDRCCSINELTESINAEAKNFLLRRLFRSRILENQYAACSQYADMASVLHSFANELGSDIKVESGLERKLSKYLHGLDVDSSVAVFRVRSGRLRVEIRSSSLHLIRKDENYLNKLSSVLGTRLCTSDEINTPGKLVLLEAEPLKAGIGIAAVKKSIGHVSGDRGSYFRTDDGVLYVILSDGMGSGVAAAHLSDMAVSSLEMFLKAGVPPELALKLLGDLMFLKNEMSTESAAIDLLCLDMFTGDTEIFKYGAAPSYLKKGDIVRRITGGIFPAGLIRPGKEKNTCIKAKLTSGTFAVLVSDGVISGKDDKWLRELLGKYTGSDPKELSRSILEAAVRHSSGTDDMTVLAVCTEDRG